MRRWMTFSTVVIVGLLALLIGCYDQPGQAEFSEALAEFREGNFVRSKALLENAISKNPGGELNADAYNWLGVANWRLGLVAEAVDAFSDSRRLNPDDVTPTYNLAVVLSKSGDVDQAAVLFEEAKLIDGQDTRTLEYQAQLAARQGDWASVRSLLYEALARKPESPRILTALALAELRMEGPEAASSYLGQALEKNPAYSPALYNLATIQKDYLNNPQDAKAYYRHFLELESDGPHVMRARKALMERSPLLPTPTPRPMPTATPSPVPTATPFPTAVPTTVPTSTPVLLSMPAPTPLAPPTPTLVPMATPRPRPTPVPTPTPLPAFPEYDAYLQQARELIGRGNTQDAFTAYIQAAKLARAHNRSELFDETLKKAASDCFDQAPAHFALGKHLSSKGEHKAALNCFKQAAVLKPDSDNIMKALAAAATQAEEYDTALISWRKVVEMDRGNPDAYWMLASAYEEMGSREKAAQGYQDFMRMFPEDVRIIQARRKVSELRTREAIPQRQTVTITRDSRIAPAPRPAPTATPDTRPRHSRADQMEETLPPQNKPPLDRQLNFNKTVVRKEPEAIQAYNRGTHYQSAGELDRAIYYYKRAIENDDRFAPAFYNLGSVYLSTGDLDLAKDAYLNALRLQDDMIDARYNLALIYHQLNQDVPAEKHALEVLKRVPDHANTHMLLGLIYADRSNQVDRAMFHYGEFLKLSPHSPSAREIQRWMREHAQVN